ncbi:peptidoglycan-binding protein [Brevibacterium sp. JNUCC-42]|nr:peptidoglycan-binding protein [Brevibacterium sp. JNUCC-42]
MVGMLNCFGGAKIDVDGKFGSATKSAVQVFQRSKGLSVDRIGGPNTWAALCQ